ncbi:MAG TPA: ATP phosphoribosyltransferase regulatory subunit, partial [Burkholderiaceae bacterium]|nr:ATP phosphoribosyltransferase regulatory subunit [Burkholderiaceae bacterium]
EAHADLLDEDARRRLHSNPLRILDTKNPAMQAMVEAAPKLLDVLGEASLAHFEGLKRLLTDAGLSFRINPRLVRGLDYYNRTVFEWVTPIEGRLLTITGGGRYDGLFEQLGGKSTPGVGFGMGIERVMLKLAEVAAAMPVHTPDAYVVHVDAQSFASEVAERLRDAGKSVVAHAGGGSFKSQMKKADASGARWALIIGETERDARSVSLKPLRQEGEQRLVSIDQLAAAL